MSISSQLAALASNATALEQKQTAIRQSANYATGQSDTTLYAAVQRLISGYNAGGFTIASADTYDVPIGSNVVDYADDLIDYFFGLLVYHAPNITIGGVLAILKDAPTQFAQTVFFGMFANGSTGGDLSFYAVNDDGETYAYSDANRPTSPAHLKNGSHYLVLIFGG